MDALTQEHYEAVMLRVAQHVHPSIVRLDAAALRALCLRYEAAPGRDIADAIAALLRRYHTRVEPGPRCVELSALDDRGQVLAFPRIVTPDLGSA